MAIRLETDELRHAHNGSALTGQRRLRQAIAERQLVLDVPRFTQRFDRRAWQSDGFADEGDSATWSDRACGLACLRMLLGYHRLPVPPQRELLWRGREIGAYCERGWVHTGLCELAAGFGLEGYATRQAPLELLAAAVGADVPAIISVARTFPRDRRGGHLVVFCGVSRDGASGEQAHFRDPSRWGATHREVDVDRFLSAYTGCAMFLWPQRRDAPDFAAREGRR